MTTTNKTLRETKLIQKGVSAVTFLPIEQIHGNAENPRTHKDRQIRALVKSIETFGFNIPIAVDAENKIIAGHARLLAAQRLGMRKVPVIRLDHLSSEQARAFMIADNKLSEMSTWNDELLTVHLKELSALNLDFDLEVTGFTMGEIDLKIEGLSPINEEQEDPADKVPLLSTRPPVTSPGDLWLLDRLSSFLRKCLGGR